MYDGMGLDALLTRSIHQVLFFGQQVKLNNLTVFSVRSKTVRLCGSIKHKYLINFVCRILVSLMKHDSNYFVTTGPKQNNSKWFL